MGGQPVAATVNGDKGKGGVLSWLPGQKLSRCTCPGESHPGPVHNDGSYVGRSAPEIDVFEAQASQNPLFKLLFVKEVGARCQMISSVKCRSLRSGQ